MGFHGSGGKSTKKNKSRRVKNAGLNHELHPDQEISGNNDFDVKKTVRAFGAALRTSKSSKTSKSLKCDFCGRSGLTEETCFSNPRNPNNDLTGKTLEIMTSESAKSASSTKTARN